MSPSGVVSPPESLTASATPRLRGLYALADADACMGCGIEVEALARCFLAAGLPLVQLRAKSWSVDEVGKLAERLLSFVGPNTRLILNDHLELVLELRQRRPEAAPRLGLHVGQGDVPVATVRRLAPDLIVGLSTHDEMQVREAIDGARPDYLAYGPIFGTGSKRNPEPATGLHSLQRVHEELSVLGLPLVAIGGIQGDSLDSVSCRCDLVASISMVLPPTVGAGASEHWARETQAHCRALHQRICSTLGNQNAPQEGSPRGSSLPETSPTIE